MAKDDKKQKLIKATDYLLKDRSISTITTKEIITISKAKRMFSEN